MTRRAQNVVTVAGLPEPRKNTPTPPTMSPFVRFFTSSLLHFFTYSLIHFSLVVCFTVHRSTHPPPPTHRSWCIFDPRRLSLFPGPGL